MSSVEHDPPQAVGLDPASGTHRLKTIGSVLHQRISRANRVAMLAIRVVLAAVLLFDLAIVIANVVARQMFHSSLSWETSYSELALLAIGFLGGAVAFCGGQHITVDYLAGRLSATVQTRLRIGGQWLAVWLAATTFVWAIQSYPQAAAQTIAGVSLSEGVFAIVLAVAMGAVALDTALHAFDNRWRDNLAGFVMAAAMALIAYVGSQLEWVVSSQSHVLIVCVVLTIITIVAGVPLTIALLLFVVVFTISGRNLHAFVPLGLESGLGDFILLAIPFFVLAGYLMTEGGLGRAIVNLLAPVLGRLPGGSLQLMVGTMFIFSGMTGAKIADVTAVGTAMSDTLAEEGYDKSEVACVLAACASAGEVVPPSIALLILGTITSISIGTLLVAGILPAIVAAVLICLLIAVRDRRGLIRGGRRDQARPGRPDLGQQLIRGVLALGLPVLLLGGIESGYFTATEAAAVSVLYAVVVTSISRERMSLRQMWRIVEQAAATSGLLLLVISIASTVGNSAAFAQVPQNIASGLASLGDSKVVFLLLTIAIVPIAGALLEGIPAILIFAPLLVPTAQQLGLNLVHYGIVFVLSLGIGAFSPLLGIGFYTAMKVAGAEIGPATRRYLPYFGVLLAGTLLVAFVPVIALALPRWLNYAGA